MRKHPDDLRLAYEQVFRSHDGIVDFRAKLLALLPLASGAGIFLLLGRSPASNQHLPAIGAFGALVTIGLFLYELRGIQKCYALSACGKLLEKELKLTKPHGIAAFTDEPKPFLGLLSNALASAVVYSAVFGAWLYVATYSQHPPVSQIRIFAGGFIVVVFFARILTFAAEREINRDTATKASNAWRRDLVDASLGLARLLIPFAIVAVSVAYGSLFLGRSSKAAMKAAPAAIGEWDCEPGEEGLKELVLYRDGIASVRGIRGNWQEIDVNRLRITYRETRIAELSITTAASGGNESASFSDPSGQNMTCNKS